jgi:hypothetical protein
MMKLGLGREYKLGALLINVLKASPISHRYDTFVTDRDGLGPVTTSPAIMHLSLT